MAKFVGAFGVPHTPIFAHLVAREGPSSETGKLFASLREDLTRAAPDVLVIFDTDHLNTFFLDNLPMLAVGVDESFRGPNDEPPAIPMQSVPSHPALAQHIRSRGIGDGFDLALVQKFSVDHSIMVPLHFLTPKMDIPVIPIFINGHVEPLPSAQRAFALGQSVRRAIDAYDGTERVAVIGSGSFSLDVYGPLVAPGMNFGVPDPGWVDRVRDHMRDGAIAALVAEATSERMLGAGNVGGELLNWIAMLGAAGERPADWITLQPQNGHGYGAWREKAA
jgi:gallate dioxygenase